MHRAELRRGKAPARRWRLATLPGGVGQALLLALAAAVLAGTGHWIAGEQRLLADGVLASTTRERDTLRGELERLAGAERDRQALRRHLAAASERGSGTRRSDWIAAIEAAAAKRRLPPPTYRFVPVAATGNAPGLRRSRLWFQQTLHHTGDLLSLLDELRRSSAALVRTERCRLSRQAAPTGDRLIGECEIAFTAIDLGSETQ